MMIFLLCNVGLKNYGLVVRFLFMFQLFVGL